MSLNLPRFLEFHQADYHSRFIDDAFGFALTWNCWLSDTIVPATDVIALQLLLEYWTDNFPGWAISLIFLAVVIGLNLLSVRFYGEASLALSVFKAILKLTVRQVEYWLSILKVVTIIVCSTALVYVFFSNPDRCLLFWELPSTAVRTRIMNILVRSTFIPGTLHSWTVLVDLHQYLSQLHLFSRTSHPKKSK